jgi:hypothetical protein
VVADLRAESQMSPIGRPDRKPVLRVGAGHDANRGRSGIVRVHNVYVPIAGDLGGEGNLGRPSRVARKKEKQPAGVDG